MCEITGCVNLAGLGGCPVKEIHLIWIVPGVAAHTGRLQWHAKAIMFYYKEGRICFI